MAKAQKMNLLSFITILSLSSGAFAKGICESVLLIESVRITQGREAEILNHPERFLNQRLQFSRNSHVAGPLQIVRRDSLPKEIGLAVQDLYILSRDSYLREEFFGSATRNFPYSKQAKAPLRLAEKSNGEDGSYVEVGVEVIETKKGQKYYIYSTSNDRNAVVTDYGYLVSVLETLNLRPSQVSAVHSFHTHPRNLFPTAADKDYFKQEAAVLKAEFPRMKKIPFEWNIHTAIEHQPYFHRVNIQDWL